MSNIKHYVTSIKNGEVYFDEQFKFALILHEVGILHLIFAILFLIAVIVSAVSARIASKRIVEPLNRIDLENPDEKNVYEE